MINKIRKFITLSWYEKLFIIKKRLYFIYKFFYGGFGYKSIIKNPMFIPNKKKIFIGKNVLIRDYARIEPILEWGDNKYNPQIIIGDNASIEQNLHLTCANKVEIQENVTISANVMITDIDHLYTDINTDILHQGIKVKSTYIGSYCLIGLGSRIMAGVKIGRNCIIGANSVVTKDIPDYSVAAGVPAKVIKKYNFDTKTWEKINDKGELANE